MRKVIGKIFVLALTGALMIYSALRSLDFIQLTLPPDKQILGYFALAALDGGLVIWLVTYLHGASGSWQRAMCAIMIAVDFLGCVGMFTADTLFNTGSIGLTNVMPEQTIFLVVIVLSAIIAMNIGAAVVHTLTDPDVMAAQAKEEAHGKIRDRASKIRDQKLEQSAAVIAADWAAADVAEIEAESNLMIEEKKSRTSRKKVEISRVPQTQLPASLPSTEVEKANFLQSLRDLLKNPDKVE